MDQSRGASQENTPAHCREVARRIGPATLEVVEGLLAERPLDKLRSAQAILRLVESVGARRVEAACERALFYGDGRYRRIKDILNAALDQQPLPAQEEKSELKPKHRGCSFAFERSASEFFGSPSSEEAV